MMALLTAEIWHLNFMSMICNGKEILFYFKRTILNCTNKRIGIIYTECFPQVSKEQILDVYLFPSRNFFNVNMVHTFSR